MQENLPTTEAFDKLYASNGNFSKVLMFWEMSTPAKRAKYPPVFTLKQNAYKGLPSAYLVYMDAVDEYDAATKLTPNMKMWDELVSAQWFFEGDPRHGHQGLKVWREHKRAKDASAMKALLIKKAKGGDTTAAKAVLQETKGKAPVGRKSKQKVGKTPQESRVIAFKQKSKAK